MGSQAVLFYGVLLPEVDEDETQDDIIQRATGTMEACERARSCEPCDEALAALGVETVLVGSDNDDNCGLALAVIGSVRKGFTGTPTPLDNGLPGSATDTLHRACSALGLSVDTEGWYLTVANV